jgi:hypothetical protein
LTAGVHGDGMHGGSRQMGMARRRGGKAARVNDGSRFPVVLLLDPMALSPSSTATWLYSDVVSLNSSILQVWSHSKKLLLHSVLVKP